MKVYRCKACGYLHVGSAPEECPMCHGPQSLFSEYEVPNVAGTKTAENLAAAFAGESQANRKYTLWQQIAKDSGDEASAAAFDRPMAEETAHALSEAIYLGMFGDVKTNLQNAAEGERYEEENMYPEFAKRPMAEETAHALSEAIYLGMFGDVKTNLQNAAEGERYEEENMYPEFAKVAEEEGFPEIAHFFKMTAHFEGQHKQGYAEAAAKLQ